MTMNCMITRTINMKTFATVLLGILLLTTGGNAQTPHYQLLLKNDSLSSKNVYEFDIVIERIDSALFELATLQPILTFDPTISSGTLNLSIISGSSELDTLQQPVGMSTSGSELRINPRTPPGSGAGTVIPSSPGLRVGRFRITSSVPFANKSANISWKNQGSNPMTKVNAYVDGTNTVVTDTTGHSSQLTNVALSAWTITASATSGGTISPSGTFLLLNGSTRSFAIAPATGYHLDSLIVDGGVSDSSTSYTFSNVTADHTIHAVFAINQYVIDASSGSNGSINPSGNINVSHGANQLFTFSPDSSYQIDSVFVDGVYIGSPSSYMFTNVGSGHSINVRFISERMTYALDAGWNMISFPRLAADARKNTLFPTSTSDLFAFEAGYQRKDTLVHGKGYWLKFGASQSRTVTGTPVYRDTINVQSGWNMIGSLASPIDIAAIQEVPSGIVHSSYFKYENGYSTTDTISPGAAYWVKTNAEGKLILEVTGTAATLKVSRREELVGEAFVPSVTLNFATKEGEHSQQLALTRSLAESRTIKEFDQPPVPPAGAFDVRFGSHRNLEVLPAKTVADFPLLLQASDGKISCTWSVDDENIHTKYLLIGKSSKGKNKIYRLQGTGTISLSLADDLTYSVRVEEIPQTFALHQNYPNPFNPQTTIGFDLPAPSIVTLKVYNLLGQEVATLMNDQRMDEGQQSVRFDGSQLASGVYFYRLVAHKVGSTDAPYSNTRKLNLIR